MTNLSSLIKNGQLLQVQAGPAAINANDMVQIGGPGLKAFPVKTLDFAVRNAAGNILAPTSFLSFASALQSNQNPCYVDPYGNIFVSAGNSTLYKYSPTGVQLGTVSTNVGNQCQQIFALSNGSILHFGFNNSTNNIGWAIVDPNTLGIVASNNSTYQAQSPSQPHACALSGGGFAFVFQDNSATTSLKLATYSNAGAPVLAATAIATIASNSCWAKVGQLSSGNLAICYASATVAGSFKVGVRDTSGVQVSAFATPTSMTGTPTYVDLSVLQTGYFAVTSNFGSGAAAAVFNDAGVQQGSTLTGVGSAPPASGIGLRLINDGTKFYLGCTQAGGNIDIRSISTAGAATTITQFSASNNYTLDMAVAQNTLVVFTGSGANSGPQQYWNIHLADTGAPIVSPKSSVATLGTNATTSGCLWPKVVFTGDFTAIFVYDQQTAATTSLGIVKMEASAIVGVSQTTNAANNAGTPSSPTIISVNTGPGSYPANLMTGTNGTSFDHTSTVPAGNKGRLYTNGAALSGIGIPRNIN